MKYDILTIGSANIDTFIEADFLKTIKDSKNLSKIGFKTGQAQCFSLGSKIEIQKPFVTIGGGAHNSAVTFSKSGFKTSCLFNVGNDFWGGMIISQIKNKKITPIAIVDKGKTTGSAFILLDKTGERTILVNRGCSGEIEKKEIPVNKLKTKWAYISPGSMPFEVLTYLIKILKKNGACIAINPSKDVINLGISKIKNILNLSDVVILNREEASYLTNVPYSKAGLIFKKLDQFIKGIVLMTDGKNGAIASDGKILWEAGVFKEKKIIDRTGAGDAFGSGFVAGLMDFEFECLKGRCTIDAINYALKRASANATSVIERMSATDGALTKKEFNSNPRWKKLKINITKI